MIKVLMFIVAACLLCRWALGRWPWDYLRAVPSRSQSIQRARKLLGVSGRADVAEIREAHRRKSGLLHPDKGGSEAQMQELNAARDLLLGELAHKTEETPQ